MSNKVIGRVVATEKCPTTIDHFGPTLNLY